MIRATDEWLKLANDPEPKVVVGPRPRSANKKSIADYKRDGEGKRAEKVEKSWSTEGQDRGPRSSAADPLKDLTQDLGGKMRRPAIKHDPSRCTTRSKRS